jgi:hypothetical protein
MLPDPPVRAGTTGGPGNLLRLPKQPGGWLTTPMFAN